MSVRSQLADQRACKETLHTDINSSVRPDDLEPATVADNDTHRASTSVDIEHIEVEDDPRRWSSFRKWIGLIIVASGAFIAGLATSIYNPGIADIKAELGASDGDISLSLSIYIILSGLFPMLWSSLSELYGRRPVYLSSMLMTIVGCIVAAEAKSIAVLIGMRCIQAAGTSAMMAVGAGTLADIYDSHERGSKLGLYYAAPMLGPSFGPFLGGILTQYLGWRSTFWFLAIWTGVTVLGFIWPFKETFRRERSATYQKALAKRHVAGRNKLRVGSTVSTGPCTPLETPISPDAPTPFQEKTSTNNEREHQSEFESKQDSPTTDNLKRIQSTKSTTSQLRETRLHLADLNPFPPMLFILRRWTNLAILIPSGLVFGFSYSIQYTATLVLERVYHLNALHVGLVLLAYGCGSILGSVLGGRFSDWCYARGLAAQKNQTDSHLSLENGNRNEDENGNKDENGKKETSGHVKPAESRLRTPLYSLPFLPPLIAAYGWLASTAQPLASLVVILFVTGFVTMWTYAALTSYLVDANPGSAAIAAAANSLFRGACAFISAEASVPVRDRIGEGGLYSVWAGIWVLGAGGIWGVWRWGYRARERGM